MTTKENRTMTALDELSRAIGSVAQTVAPSVVGIGSRLRGAGIVVADGQVLTNAHNLRGDEVTVTFSDGRRTRGTVTGADMEADLAVVSVDTAGATPVEWADEGAVALGTVVFGVAATPMGGPRVTVGFVSALERSFRGPAGRRIGGSIEHTAPLAPGSSGGPIVDAGGRLLGIDTNRLGDGFYLAIPADAALRDRVSALGRGEVPSRVRLGVAVAPGHVARRLRRSVGLPERDGLLVRAVEEGSLAERAGIQEGDLIVAAGGRSVADVDDLHDALAVLDVPFEVTIVRGTEERAVSVGGTAATGEA
jgi:serine protease Do